MLADRMRSFSRRFFSLDGKGGEGRADRPAGGDADRKAGYRDAALALLALDEGWYQRRYPAAKLHASRGGAYTVSGHYAAIGRAGDLDPAPLVSPRHARRRAGLAPGEDILRHIASTPTFEDLHWLFDPAFFEAHFGRKAQNDYLYFLASGGKGVRASALFDQRCYADALGRPVEGTPFADYLRDGCFQGVPATRLVDEDLYLRRCPDAAAAISSGRSINVLHHFLEEGRHLGISPFTDFDADYYLSRPKIEEVGRGGRNPIDHFLVHGLRLNISPIEEFDAEEYVAENPEAREDRRRRGMLSFYEHYLVVGRPAGRRGRARTSVGWSRDGLIARLARVQGPALRERPIRFAGAPAPEISIIVPVHDGLPVLLGLLDDIRLQQPELPGGSEVIVVENGSTDGAQDIARFVENAVVVAFPQALGFAGAANAGARRARGRILVFLNSDIRLLPGALANLVGTLDAQGDAGICGGLVLMQDGRVQELGGQIRFNGSGAGRFRGVDPMASDLPDREYVDYVSGCLLAVRRSLFLKLRGFAEAYNPGYYEDTELCLRAWAAGHAVVATSRAAALHAEYSTFRRSLNGDLQVRRQMERNHRVFLRRNEPLLHGPSRLGRLRRPGTGSGGRLVFVDDRAPEPGLGSGFTRAWDILRTLRADLGVDVVLHTNAPIEPSPAGSDDLLRTVSRAPGPEGLAELLHRQTERITWVWLSRTHNFRSYFRVLEKAWDEGIRPRTIFDIEAIGAVRDRARDRAAGIREPRLPWGRLLEAELAPAENADVVVAVSEYERRLASLALGGRSVAVLGHRVAARATPAPWDARRDILLLGAIHRPDSPNYDGLCWFLSEVMPRIHAATGAVCRVAGYVDPSVAMDAPELAQPFVEPLGFVEDLAPLLDGCRLMVAPTRFSSGVPRKVHEAFAAGLPVVAPPALALQATDAATIGRAGRCVSIAPLEPGAFAEAVCGVYLDAARWSELSGNGLDHARTRLSAEAFAANLRRMVLASSSEGRVVMRRNHRYGPHASAA